MAREQPWGRETEHVVKKYTTRWTPQTAAASFCEPDCPPGDARELVWKLRSNDAAQRASLSLVVDEMERLSIAGRSNSLQTEYEPTDDIERGKIKELWLNVQRHMEACSDDPCNRVYDEFKRVCEQLQDSEGSSNSTMLERLHALVADFYRLITMSSEQASIARLSSTRATTTSLQSFYSRIESMSTVLG
ncbi:hypothetical protein ON010_g16278 [Phytophthora cinnamomi]|nr:hypothetical protein ON010_g16278 [Phytophthora cinnamomi]